MTDIFISYSRKDVEMVSKLASALEELGYAVWWDVSGLHGGQAFAEVIQEKLSEAKCAIVIWSEYSVKSKWVHSEANFADSRDILLTVTYQDAQPPMPFNTRHNENLRGWNGRFSDDGFQKFLKAIGQFCPAPAGQLWLEDAGSAKKENIINVDPTASEDSVKASPGINKIWVIAVAAAIVFASGAFFLYSKKRVISPVNQTQVKKLSKASERALNYAREALADNRLTAPKNINVVTFAARVLKEDPTHSEAFTLLTEAASLVQVWAESSIEKHSFNNAQRYLAESSRLIEEYSLTALVPKQEKLISVLKVEKGLPAEVEVEQVAVSKVYKLANSLVLLPMPAGSFSMGSDDSSFGDEKPVHKVTFAKPFWMSKTEITFDQYDAYVEAEGVDKPSDSGWGRGSRPVINVSWDDAQGFMKWLTSNNGEGLQCSLPSEAEWEYAARAGTDTKYSWGNKLGDNQANCLDCGSQWDNKVTAPAGSFPANQWGLQDMHGNVSEWVQDRWHKDYTNAPESGEAWMKNGHPSQTMYRGGSSFDTFYRMHNSARGRQASYFRLPRIGFRVACTAEH